MENLIIKDFDYVKHKANVLEISRKIWFDDVKPFRTSYISNLHFLLHYLLSANKIKVACIEENGQEKVVGVLAIQYPKKEQTSKQDERNKHFFTSRELRKLKCLNTLSSIYMHICPLAQSTRVFDELFFSNYEKLRKIMPQDLRKECEITLLISDKSYQNLGIGKALMQDAIKHIKDNGYSKYYLLTDSSCTYQFYEKFGMQRVVDVNISFNIDHVKDYQHYLNCCLRGYVYVGSIE